MRSELTDDEIRQHRDNFGKIAVWLGSPPKVTETTAGIVSALDELLSRRAEERSG